LFVKIQTAIDVNDNIVAPSIDVFIFRN